MRLTPPPAFRLLCLVIGFSLVASGCSFTRLGYQNIEWLTSWKMNDYVSLDREQKRWLRSEVKRLHAWHCAEELPRYTTLIAAARDDFLAEEPTATAIQARLESMQIEAERTLDEIVPTLATLAASLSDDQAAELLRNLQEQQTEYRTEYTKPDIATQNAERSERMQKRLSHWLGSLDAAQVARVDEWAARLEGHSQLWLENRDLWLIALQQALQNRHAPDLDEKIGALVLRSEELWTPAYRKQRAHSLTLSAELLQDVSGNASAEQRQHLVRRSNSYMDDIARVRCPPTNG